MDELRLKGLKFRGLHGVYEQERIVGNDFEVDLTFKVSLEKPSITDELDDTLDYQKIFEVVKTVLEGPSVKLIEHLARKIGDLLVLLVGESTHFQVTVRKLSPPVEGTIDYSEVTLSWPR